MNNQITIEQAIKNVEVVIIEQFRGSRQEHIILEHSLNKIKEYTIEALKIEAEPIKTHTTQSEVGC